MMAKRLAGMDIGQMNFDKRNFDCGQCIAQRDRSMRESGGVDDDEIQLFTSQGMQFADQIGFTVALEGFERDARRLRLLDEQGIDVVQCFPALMLRLAQPQEIKVGAVQHQYRFPLGSGFRE